MAGSDLSALASLMPRADVTGAMTSVAEMMRLRNLAPYQRAQAAATTQLTQQEAQEAALKNEMTQLALGNKAKTTAIFTDPNFSKNYDEFEKGLPSPSDEGTQPRQPQGAEQPAEDSTSQAAAPTSPAVPVPASTTPPTVASAMGAPPTRRPGMPPPMIPPQSSSATPAGMPTAAPQLPAAQRPAVNAPQSTANPLQLHPLAQYAASQGLPLQGPGGAMELSDQMFAHQEHLATLHKTTSDALKADLENHEKQVDNWNEAAAPVIAGNDPQALPKFLARVQAAPGQYPPDVMQAVPQIKTLADLQEVSSAVKMHEAINKIVKDTAEAHDVAPFPPEKIADLNDLLKLRYQVSNPGKDLPASYALKPGADPKDYDRIDKTLTQTEQAAATNVQRGVANALAQQGADLRNAEYTQKQEIRNEDPVVAFDPKTNQRVFTTRGDAAANGLVGAGKAVSEQEIGKEEATTRQFNDVQMNVSRYKTAYANLKGPLSDTDVNNMTLIQSLTQKLEKPGEGGFVSSLSAGYVPALANSAQRQSLAKAWGSLSPDARELETGYLRAMGSIPAYQRALTNTGRTSQQAMQIEMANLPVPTAGYTAASPQLKAFQENIDVASQGLIKFPWLEGPKDIQSRIESQIRTPEAVKPQGQYRGTGVVPGGQVIVDKKLRTVSQVYSDGTYDVK